MDIDVFPLLPNLERGPLPGAGGGAGQNPEEEREKAFHDAEGIRSTLVCHLWLN
jgi:hypothetical protein